jgi:hypothetical protein
MLLVYVDDCILAGPDSKAIDREIKSLQRDYDLTDEGDLNNYLGLSVTRDSEGAIHVTQPHLIQRIIAAVGLQDDSKMHNTPANVLLHKDTDGPPFDAPWKYRSLVGMLSYLANTSRPDISMAVHQCARFSINPRKSHQLAIKRIARYLKATADKGLILRPESDPNLDVWVDADFAGSYNKSIPDDPSNVLSRTGFAILYAGCPIVWSSKMQTEIALSTTEAEYIALSTAMRDVIPIKQLFDEMRDHKFLVPYSTPALRCTVFEDNSGALELARAPKMRPRTKHIAIKYHHFRAHIKNKSVQIVYTPTKEQLADILTKPIPATQFIYLRKKLCGW